MVKDWSPWPPLLAALQPPPSHELLNHILMENHQLLPPSLKMGVAYSGSSAKDQAALKGQTTETH